MTEVIERILHTALHSLAMLPSQATLSCMPISGGDMHMAYRVRAENIDCFVKLSPDAKPATTNSAGHIASDLVKIHADETVVANDNVDSNADNSADKNVDKKVANTNGTDSLVSDLRAGAMADVLATEYVSLDIISKLLPGAYLPSSGFYHQQGWAALIMPYQDLSPLTAQSASVLGSLLARQHRITQTHFGWTADNFIGHTLQLNQWQQDWVPFYIEQRLRPQLNLAVAQGASSDLLDFGLAVIDVLPHFFVNYSVVPSLLHGDLWSGNVASCLMTQASSLVPDSNLESDIHNATACLFDPAPYFGDRETDLAMSELFGGFPAEFYAAYQAAYPLDAGYQQRKPLYQLYHILNHYNLFGGHYQQQALQLMQGLLRSI